MRITLRGILCLLALAATVAARAGAVNAAPEPAQGTCAAAAGEKLQKFTGQISAADPTLLEVKSGNESVAVHYTVRVPVCEGGRLVPDAALRPGASVVVYGPITRQGSAMEITALKIVVGAAGVADSVATGSSLGEVRGPEGATNSGATAARGLVPVDNGNSAPGKAATDDWNSGASGLGSSAPPSNPGGSQGLGIGGGQDSSGITRGRGQNSGGLSCSALLFNVNGPHEAVTGQAAGRSSASAVTCKRAVDQTALQLMQDAVTGKRLGTVTLNWQNQLEVSLADAEISSVQFTSDTGAQVVEITFAYQKAEIAYLPSGTRVSF